MSSFNNAPIYSVGDSFVSRGETSTSSGRGADYTSYNYYEYDRSSASEYYQTGEQSPGATVRSESFHYYADPSNGIVNDVSKYLDLDVYDSNERKLTKDRFSNHQYDWGEETRTESSELVYVDEVSRKLLSTTEIRESSYTSYDSDFNDSSTEEITFTYDYTGLKDSEIYGEWDFTTKWGVGTRNYQNNEGDNQTFELFSKENRAFSNSSNSWEEFRIETDDQIIANAHVSSDQQTRNGSTYINIDTSDHDRDGIIDSRHEHSQRYKGDNWTSISISKHDYDGDGQADDIYMSRERGSNSGTQRTEYRYNTQSANRPILEVIKSRTDRNGSPQIISENSVFRTLTPKHTAMGDHILELTDVLA